MRWVLRDPAMVLLTISAATLAAVLALELHLQPVAPAQRHAPQQGDTEVEPPSLSNTPTLSLPPPDSFTEMVQRPLFNAARRPREQSDGNMVNAKSSMADASDQEVRLVLIAVIIRGDEQRALLRDPAAGEVFSARAGERVGSWSLAEVHADRVVLKKQGSTVTLALRRYESGSHSARSAE